MIAIEYASARRDQLAANPKLPINFSIDYRMDTQGYLLAIYIGAGTLAALSIAISCMRIWNWNKRSGRYGCDQVTLFKFFISAVGFVGNSLFFVVVFGTLYWLIVYRGCLLFKFLPGYSSPQPSSTGSTHQ